MVCSRYRVLLVVDNFLGLRNSASLNVLLVLLGLYFTFNLSCNKLQELIFQFVEECV